MNLLRVDDIRRSGAIVEAALEDGAVKDDVRAIRQELLEILPALLRHHELHIWRVLVLPVAVKVFNELFETGIRRRLCRQGFTFSFTYSFTTTNPNTNTTRVFARFFAFLRQKSESL
jgi:hypothetical protein